MSKLKSAMCAAALAGVALPGIGFAANLNPPKVTDTTSRSITMRQMPGFEARCFKESTLRERGDWTTPTKSSSDYRTRVELRNGVEYVTLTTQAGTDALKFLMELNADGSMRKVPALIETSIPGFEKEYGPALRQVVTRTMAGMGEGFLGRTLEVGKDYGATMNICTVLGAQSASSPKGKTVLEGTLTYAGRPGFLVSQTYEQACTDNGVRFTVEGSAWSVHDLVSSLVMSNAGSFELFAQGTRFRRAEEFVECGVTEKK